VKLSGRGKCFSVGGDLTEFGSLPDPASAHLIRALTMPGRFLAQCAARLECHVHGACIGSGVELPAFCQRVTAAKDTFFHMPELQLGLLPGGGGCVSIPRRIGRQRTAWWVLSGRRINAKTALAWGLIDELV
jgi:enoyl-CoA hydratase